MPGPSISAAPGQLRQGAVERGRGWTQLLKQPQPAAGGGFTYVIPGDYWQRVLSLAFTLVTSAVGGTRQLAVAYADGDGYVFNLVPISNEISVSQQLTGYGDLASVTPVQVPRSHQAEASVTTPGALTNIVSLALPSGGWTLSWQVQLAGTPAAADANNFGLYNAAALVVGDLNPGAVGGPWPQETIEVQVPVGGATYNIKNIAAGTAGAIYSAQLVASPSNLIQLQVQLPDFVMKSGWQVQLQLAGAQAGDQLSGIGLLVEQYPSSDIDRLASFPPEVLAELIAGMMTG